MRLSLIGMSGSGKSHWSKKLTAYGFKAFHCDDLIEELLTEDLLGADGIPLSVGEWMGDAGVATLRLLQGKFVNVVQIGEKKVTMLMPCVFIGVIVSPLIMASSSCLASSGATMQF